MEKENFQLIQKCKQGDTSAKGWLYKNYAPVLLGICERYIPDKMQAEDVLHESFIVIFEKIKNLKNEQAFVGWMKRIVVNNALKQLKNQKNFYAIDEINETEIIETDTDNNANIKEQILQLEISQEYMLKIISGLPAGFRAVFNLYVFENWNHDEIAKKLGISPATSRSQLLRARKLIQKRLYELVQEQKKSKKEEKVLLSSLILVMNDDLNYIDKLAANKLSDYCPLPSSFSDFSTKGGKPEKAVSTGLKQKLILIACKKIVWMPTLLAGISGIMLFGFFSQNEKTPAPVINQQPAPEIPTTLPDIDTLNFGTIIKEEDQIDESANNAIQPDNNISLTDTMFSKNTVVKKKVVHQKVIMKKVITVKKKQEPLDTIKK